MSNSIVRNLVCLLCLVTSSTLVLADEPLRCWQPHEIVLSAQAAHDWWEFPVRVRFTREDETAPALTVEGVWNGDNHWLIRTALPKPGRWHWASESNDPGLDGVRGKINVVAASGHEISDNPNLHGQLRIAKDHRHFEFADGTPFLLLADTLWAANTSRCGLGTNDDGPFFQYLTDRKQKGFTAILMQYFHGYGDYPKSPGHRNEGGKPYADINSKTLNPAFFQSLDRRMDALWQRGFVAAIPATWWGKTNHCVFTPEDAKRISAYCAVRYGAYNAIWSLSGEYQYAFKDCGFEADDFNDIGNEVQRHNPFHHPLSIHPSSRTDLAPPHNVQSSKPFHDSPWLDHHWLQTGQKASQVSNIVTRIAENRQLQPAVPVFCSEAFYERGDDAESAYHTRWQVWTAMLNGAAGFGYGANGIWQFLDPADPNQEPGKTVDGVLPWREAIRRPGSNQVRHASTLLSTIDWWTMQPASDSLVVDGKANRTPTPDDMSPPQAAITATSDWIIYLPRGNQGRKIVLSKIHEGRHSGRWFNPSTGVLMPDVCEVVAGVIPERPNPQQEDWVFVVAGSQPQSNSVSK